MHMLNHRCESQRTFCGCLSSPSTIWIPRIKFRSSDLAGSTFTWWFISAAPDLNLGSTKTNDNKCWWRFGHIETLSHCWWGYLLVQPLWKPVWRLLKKKQNYKHHIIHLYHLLTNIQRALWSPTTEILVHLCLLLLFSQHEENRINLDIHRLMNR